MSADQTVVLITDTNLRRCGLKDCWFSAVSIQFIQTLILSKLCCKNDTNYSNIKSKGLDFIFHGMINQKKKGG